MALPFIGRNSWLIPGARRHGRTDEVTPLVSEIVHAAVEREAVIPDEQCVLLPLHSAVVV